MKKVTSFLSVMILTLGLFFACGMAVNAAEPGTLPSNAIPLTNNVWQTKYWTNSNYDLNCFNKIVIPSRGYITFTASKPFDDEGEMCSYYLYLYDENGVVVWAANTSAQTDSFNEYYTYKIGLDAGTYYMNIDPSFYVYRDSAPIETSHKYSFTPANDWEIEANNNQEQATVIELDKTYHGVYTDESYNIIYMDYYKVYLTKGRNYEIYVGNYNALDAGTLILDMYDPAGNDILPYSGKDSGNSKYWTITAGYTGWYYVVFDNDGNDVGTEYTISVKESRVSAANATVTLSRTEYVYNGKAQSPSVTVTLNSKKLIKGTDYIVTYENGRTEPGKYTVTVTFIGGYSGEKSTTFTIKPKATTKVTATQSSTYVTLKWSKVTGADGYRVYKYNPSKKKYETYKSTTSTSLKVTGLKSGTKYKFKVRAYTKDSGTIWGNYSSEFETATKTKTPTLKVTSTSKGKANLSWTNVSGESGYQVYYSTKKGSDYKKLASYKSNVVKGSKTKLKSGKKYYFKVRAYTKTESGTVYGSWSSVKSIKIK